MFIVESEKVTNFEVSSITSQSVRFSWSAPTNTNGDLVYYNVSISNATFHNYTNVSIPNTTHSFKNLDAGKTISIFKSFVNVINITFILF